MEIPKITDFWSDKFRAKPCCKHLNAFNEVSESLKVLNEQHRIIHTTIKDMMAEYHLYHILKEECETVANSHPSDYFETVYHHIKNWINDE